ncbi:hypothetical protein D3877_28815 [Azospirillum cavernae]|uniref:SGNH/GDSL hydrolase family protein n=1 Tax=Azospirillum cavernae TaxID=2320860 RepID=A0A418VL60_9PROT|nr:hypothetical protein [Azospirillum cavernae]RJF76882.1 hypothetical protein D3877_28815 [Azospirillum cavernae]
MPEAHILLGSAPLWGGGLAVLLLCLEILARAERGIALLSRRNFIAEAWGDQTLAHDPVVGWRLRDHHHSEDGAFTTGDHGVRLTGTGPPSQGGIMIVGDSFTVGPGLADGETWPAHLERRLGRPVINGSCGGYGVDQIVLRAEHLAALYRPAAIVLAVLDHDILRNGFARFGSPKPWFVPDADGLRLEGVPIPQQKSDRRPRGVRRIAGHSYFLQTLFTRFGAKDWWLGSAPFARVHGAAVSSEIACRLMRRVAELRDRLNVPVAVLMLYNAPRLGEEAPDWFSPPVLDAARREGLIVVDSFPPLHALCRDDPDRFAALWLPTSWRTSDATGLARFDYLSDAGSGLIAAMVADALKRNGRPDAVVQNPAAMRTATTSP